MIFCLFVLFCFFNRGFTTAVFRPRSIMPIVRDVLMMLGMVGKEMSRLSYRSVVGMGSGATLNYFQDKVISDRVKGL